MALIDSYFTDTINIISQAVDENGVSTESVQGPIDCRIEDKNKLITNREGKEVTGNMQVILNPDIDIKYESLIQILTRNGEATQAPTKKFIIKELGKPHGFTKSHWEVWL